MDHVLLGRSVVHCVLALAFLSACDQLAGDRRDQENLNAQASQAGPTVEVLVNRAPRVTFMGSSTGLVTAGNSVQLQVVASDPDGDAIGFRWTASCTGSFGHDDASQVTFLAGASPVGTGTCTFEVAVEDGHGGKATGMLTLSTVPPAIRVGPVIEAVSQSEEVIAAQASVVLQATATGPLTWTWLASAGALLRQTDAEDTSSVIWEASATPGTKCAITVTATNLDGASAAHQFFVLVSP